MGRPQFCPRIITIQPQNAVEGTYAALVTFFGLAVFYLYASTITCSFMEFRALRGETTKEFWLLRRYLRQRKVSASLKFRIMHYCEVQARKQLEMLPDAKVALLNHLSDQLGCELNFNINYSGLFEHPLMHRLDGRSRTVQELTKHALEKHMCAAGDVVSSQGLPAKCMQFVEAGTLKYWKKNDNTSEQDVHAHDWIAEATMWVPWVYQGSTKAVDNCELICIDALEFAKVVEEDKEVWAFFVYYAAHFIEAINKLPHNALCDVHTGKEAKDEVRRIIFAVQKEELPEELEGAKPNLRKSTTGSFSMGGGGRRQSLWAMMHTPGADDDKLGKPNRNSAKMVTPALKDAAKADPFENMAAPPDRPHTA